MNNYLKYKKKYKEKKRLTIKFILYWKEKRLKEKK